MFFWATWEFLVAVPRVATGGEGSQLCDFNTYCYCALTRRTLAWNGSFEEAPSLVDSRAAVDCQHRLRFHLNV